jgi:hypothetical protein
MPSERVPLLQRPVDGAVADSSPAAGPQAGASGTKVFEHVVTVEPPLSPTQLQFHVPAVAVLSASPLTVPVLHKDVALSPNGLPSPDVPLSGPHWPSTGAVALVSRAEHKASATPAVELWQVHCQFTPSDTAVVAVPASQNDEAAGGAG